MRRAGCPEDHTKAMGLTRRKQPAPLIHAVEMHCEWGPASGPAATSCDGFCWQAEGDIFEDAFQFGFGALCAIDFVLCGQSVGLAGLAFSDHGGGEHAQPAGLALEADILRGHNGVAAGAFGAGFGHGAGAAALVIFAALGGIAAL